MKTGVFVLVLLLGAAFAPQASADQVDLLDFAGIQRGMTEAEVLVRLGPPDQDSFEGFSPGNALVKSYYYFSEPERYQNIITVIRFKAGRVIDKERIYRPD